MSTPEASPSSPGGSSSPSKYGSMGGSPQEQCSSPQRSPSALSRSVSSTSSHGVPQPAIRRVSHPAISLLRNNSAADEDKEIEGSNPQQGAPQRKSIGFLTMSREKKFIVITFCLANFFVGAFYALLGPFFPNEAAKKGMNSTLTGLVFGVFEFIIVVLSPVYGKYITVIGAKFMYCTGICVCGCSAILFGFLDGSPSGTPYIVMCFVVRVVEGVGAAAFVTSSFAMMAHAFPSNVAQMFGTLEMFGGLGMMVGPPLGGALFQLGGFRLPFMVMGSGLLVFVGLGSMILLPNPGDVGAQKRGSLLGLVRIPLVLIMCLFLLMGSSCIGYLDVALSLRLEDKFHLSPVVLGVIFLVGPGVYAIVAPIFGYIGDRWPQACVYIMVAGYTVGAGAFLMMGPAPFLTIPNNLLPVVLVSLALMGLGVGSVVVAFQILTQAARHNGYPDTLETYGLISGIFNSMWSFGAFLGPMGGGYLNDQLGFAGTSMVLAFLVFFAAFVLFLYIIVIAIRQRCAPPPQTVSVEVQSENAPLLTA